MSTASPRPVPPMLTAALDLAAKGYAVFPLWEPQGGDCACGASSKTRKDGRCEHAGKHPRTPNGVDDATTDVDQVKRWWWKWPTANIAIATGAASRGAVKTGYLLVVDVDPRNRGDEALAALEQQHGPLPETVRALTGGGGSHHYFRTAVPYRGGKLVLGVDLKTDGGYVVAAPSRHQSGRAYAWDATGHPDDAGIADAPAWLCRLLLARTEKTFPPTTAALTDGLLGRAYDLAGWLGAGCGDDAATARCPWEDQHTGGTRFDSSTVIFAPGPGQRLGWAYCSHAHCGHGRSQRDYLDALPPGVVAEAKRQLGFDPDYQPEPEPIALPEKVAEDEEADWRTELRFNARGQLTKDVGNATLLLRHLPEWEGVLGYDTFAQRLLWQRSAPPIIGMEPPAVGRALEDHDLSYVHHWFVKRRQVAFTTEALYAALRAAAIPFHPVRAYLESLTWDGHPRLDIWLPQYLGTPVGPYAAFIGARFLIAAVARIMKPGCQVDTMLILEGHQGAGKSQAIRTLAGPWYLGTLPDLRSKDAAHALAGKWLVEVGELDAFKGPGSTRVKDFITQTVDTYRPAYGRFAIDQPRACVFLGTTNDDHYLRDATGARRFWPIRCGTIDLPALRQDRDQLWAEAVHRYRAGETWWPETASHHADLERAQEVRFDVDEWEPQLEAFLDGRFTVTSRECLEHLGLGVAHWTQPDQKRVAACLRHLGYERHIGRLNRVVTRHWRRNDAPS